jgi:hypothetical protein
LNRSNLASRLRRLEAELLPAADPPPPAVVVVLAGGQEGVEQARECRRLGWLDGCQTMEVAGPLPEKMSFAEFTAAVHAAVAPSL